MAAAYAPAGTENCGEAESIAKPAPLAAPPFVQRFAGIAIFVASFALAAYVVANKAGVDHLL